MVFLTGEATREMAMNNGGRITTTESTNQGIPEWSSRFGLAPESRRTQANSYSSQNSAIWRPVPAQSGVAA